MTAKELAGILSGREYGGEIYPLEERNAQAAGLVVVYGYSDNNVEFRGAIDDEVGAYEGTTIHINKSGILYAPNPDCDMDECPYLKQAVKEARSIRAVWHDEGSPCWTFETDIPHEEFDIYEDGELFCLGIVFASDDIQTKTPSDPLTPGQLRKKVPNLGAPVPELDLWNLGIIAVQENALKNYGKTWIVCRLEPEK